MGCRMALGKIVVGLLVVALVVLAAVGPADAAKPKSGNWFSEVVDPDDESNFSSIQFKVVKGKKLKKVTIYWRCGKRTGYHHFTNPPFPIAINKKKKFKMIGATTPPPEGGQSTKDFTLKGRFISRKTAKYSMKLEKCGPETTGKIIYAT